jgi:uncharacterized DUF497 family protein
MPSSFLRFQYDPAKAAANYRKHGVTFEQAITTFFDQNAVSWPDEAHSTPGDERFINLGLSSSLLLLVVVHNEGSGVVRIISARSANASERILYEEG